MTAEQLRNSILQEAISGRLVPQDPNDEPAAVLLQRIREEKARLVKEKKLKAKDIVVTPITEEEIPFEIPASWEWVRLSTYVDVRDGTHDSPKYHPSGIPFVTSKNLKNGRIDFSTCTFISQSDHDKFSERSYVEDGDILFAMIGSIGNPVIVAKDREFSVKNVALFKRYSREYTNNKYLYYYLSYIQNELKQIAAGGVQSFVGLGTLRQYLIPLPPLAEQERIVAKLEELLPIVEQYGKAQKELDELNAALPARLRQSILQEAISGRLVPQDPNDEPASVLLERMQNDKRKVIPIQDEEMPYEIPGSWEWVNLGSIVSIITGKKDANFGSEDGTYDFFTCSNTPIKCKSYSYDGDYLIMPGNGANIGKVIHYKGKFEAYQRTYLLQGYGNFDLDYLKYHLMSNWKEYNQDKLYGSAIPYIKLGNLMSYPVALPPLAEQQRIVAKIEELFEQIDKITK